MSGQEMKMNDTSDQVDINWRVLFFSVAETLGIRITCWGTSSRPSSTTRSDCA